MQEKVRNMILHLQGQSLGFPDFDLLYKSPDQITDQRTNIEYFIKMC
jgi:hypothetical protein